jgi:hypothetical protein
VKVLIGGLVVVVLATPVAGSVDDDTPPVVKLEVELPAQGFGFVDPSGLTLRVETGEAVVLVFRIFDAENPDRTADVEETFSLLEIRDLSEGSPPVRLGDMERTAPGVYRSTYTFPDPGRWMLVVQPDISDRSSLPTESTSQLVVIVEESVPAVAGGPGPIGVIALVVLVMLVGTLVIGATRRKPRSHLDTAKEPVAQDTWWNSP